MGTAKYQLCFVIHSFISGNKGGYNAGFITEKFESMYIPLPEENKHCTPREANQGQCTASRHPNPYLLTHYTRMHTYILLCVRERDHETNSPVNANS